MGLLNFDKLWDLYFQFSDHSCYLSVQGAIRLELQGTIRLELTRKVLRLQCFIKKTTLIVDLQIILPGILYFRLYRELQMLCTRRVACLETREARFWARDLGSEVALCG